jgi:hypothetical protein
VEGKRPFRQFTVSYFTKSTAEILVRVEDMTVGCFFSCSACVPTQALILEQKTLSITVNISVMC